MNLRHGVFLVLSLALVCGGCGSKTTKLDPVDLNSSDTGEKALELYDKNKDGKIDAQEMSPGLTALARTADTNEDGSLTADEIAERLKAHETSGISLQTCGTFVYLDDRLLEGAEVRLVPDPSLGDSIEGAKGTTDEDGFADLTSGGNTPGVAPGFYKIEVSLKDEDGKEQIPAHYNTESELGIEIGADTGQDTATIPLRLSSG